MTEFFILSESILISLKKISRLKKMKSTKYKQEKRKVKQTLHKVNERKKCVKQRGVREKATERLGECNRTKPRHPFGSALNSPHP